MEFEKITPETIQEVTPQEVLSLHRRAHRLATASFCETAQKKHDRVLVPEMGRRRMAHTSPLHCEEETKDLPTDLRGLYLVPPHGRLIADGTKRAIAKPRPADLEGDWILVSGKKAYGTVALGEPQEVGLEEFDRRFDEHRVRPEERERWWPESETLWLFHVKQFGAYGEPRRVEVPPGVQTVMEEIVPAAEIKRRKSFSASFVILDGVESKTPGVFSYWFGVPLSTGQKKAKRKLPKGGRWVTIRGKPVMITGPKKRGRTQVGITSARPGKTQKQIEAEMHEFEEMMKETPVENLTVQMGTGGWEGGSEPTWVTQYDGDGEAVKVLAEAGKKWDQDGVLVMRHVQKGGQPQTRLSFGETLGEPEMRGVEKMLVSEGIGGWTWGQGAKGPELIMTSIPQWGGEAKKHSAASKVVHSALRDAGYSVGLSTKRVDVTVMERDSYDDFISGERTKEAEAEKGQEESATHLEGIA